MKECNLYALFMLLRMMFFLMMPGLVFSFGLPPPPSKRFDRTDGVHFRAMDPMSESYIEYRPPEYEYGPTTQEELPGEEEYNAFDKYATIPAYGYYSGLNAPDEKESEAYGIVEDRPPGDPLVDLQEEMMEEDRRKHYQAKPAEAWLAGGFPPYEGKTEALTLTRPYGDELRYGKHLPFAYAPPLEGAVPPAGGDEDDERHWYYGVPVTEVDDSENAGPGDDSVRELESLREKMRSAQPNILDVPKAKARKENPGNAETTPVSKDKIILQLRKSIDNRKNFLPAEALAIRKKQIYPGDSAAANRLGNYLAEKKKARREEATGGKGLEAEKAIAGKATEPPPAAAKPQAPAETRYGGGQKEFVLPRPASQSFDKGITPRAPQQTSLYDTIKRILAMEEMLRKKEKFQVRKRFVLNDDQLLSELSGLKKMAL